MNLLLSPWLWLVLSSISLISTCLIPRRNYNPDPTTDEDDENDGSGLEGFMASWKFFALAFATVLFFTLFVVFLILNILKH